MASTKLATHKGYEIRKSGKSLVRIVGLGDGNREMFGRYRSVEAAIGVINANLEGRKLSEAEYALVYGASTLQRR